MYNFRSGTRSREEDKIEKLPGTELEQELRGIDQNATEEITGARSGRLETIEEEPPAEGSNTQGVAPLKRSKETSYHMVTEAAASHSLSADEEIALLTDRINALRAQGHAVQEGNNLQSVSGSVLNSSNPVGIQNPKQASCHLVEMVGSSSSGGITKEAFCYPTGTMSSSYLGQKTTGSQLVETPDQLMSSRHVRMGSPDWRGVDTGAGTYPLSGGHTLGAELSASVPRVNLPRFSGKGSWAAFWVQFEFLTTKFRWDENTKLSHLMCSLQDTAMDYVAGLPPSRRSDLQLLVESLTQRFDEHVLPETYRAMLQNMKKKPQEDLNEYAARVKTLVSKAYPQMEGTQLFTDLTVEYCVKGLSDPVVVYDVLTKKPRSVEDALEMIRWHQCCKGTNSNRTRKVGLQMDEDNSKCKDSDFVTEKRLKQFGQELKNELKNDFKEVVNDCLDNKFKKNPTTGNRTFNYGGVECYYCHELGHYLKDCPQRGKKTRQERETREQKAQMKFGKGPLN